MQVRRNLTILKTLLAILSLFERRNCLIFVDPPTRIPHFVLWSRYRHTSGSSLFYRWSILALFAWNTSHEPITLLHLFPSFFRSY